MINANIPPSALQFARHFTRAAASRAPGWLAPQARSGKNVMYLSSETGDIPPGVYILPRDGQSQTPIGMISKGTSSPQGISTNAAGELYVANLGNDTVTVYPPGALSPSATYSNGLIGPYDVAAGPDGTVYVANTKIQEFASRWERHRVCARQERAATHVDVAGVLRDRRRVGW